MLPWYASPPAGDFNIKINDPLPSLVWSSGASKELAWVMFNKKWAEQMASLPESLAKLITISVKAEYSRVVHQFTSSHTFPYKETVTNPLSRAVCLYFLIAWDLNIPSDDLKPQKIMMFGGGDDNIIVIFCIKCCSLSLCCMRFVLHGVISELAESQWSRREFLVNLVWWASRKHMLLCSLSDRFIRWCIRVAGQRRPASQRQGLFLSNL